METDFNHLRQLKDLKSILLFSCVYSLALAMSAWIFECSIKWIEDCSISRSRPDQPAGLAIVSNSTFLILTPVEENGVEETISLMNGIGSAAPYLWYVARRRSPLGEVSTSAIKMPRRRLKNFLRVIQIPQTLRSGWDNRKGKCWSDLVLILVISIRIGLCGSDICLFPAWGKAELGPADSALCPTLSPQ